MKNTKKDKIIVGTEVLLLCMIVGILGTKAASSPPSSEVNYSKNGQTNVQGSINDLYSKVAYGDAKANEILKGKKALVGGKEVVGTFTCPTLASLTLGDATPEDIIEGKIAWVNGTRVVGVKRLLAEKVELGDYISYTSKRTSYYGSTTPTSVSTLFINPSKLNLWRVIRKNEDGTVDIVSNSLSYESVTIGGTTESNQTSAYKYYIWILNDLASAFETKGITVGSRHMGYDSKYAVEILSSIPSYRPDGYLTDLGTPDDGRKTDTELVNAVYGNLDAFRVGTNIKGSYYLASRYNAFSGWQVSNCGGEKSPGYRSLTGNLYSCVGNAYKGSGGGIRPIVVLRSDLKITGGEGTASSPYTLGT